MTAKQASPNQTYGQTFEAARRLRPRLWDKDYLLLRGLAKAIAKFSRERTAEGDFIVDFGCGAKPYAPLFPTSRYVGVDVVQSEWTDIVICPGESVPLGDGVCDVVLSTQVVYMAPDPAAYLRECWRLLRPGGWLFLSTHGTWTYHPASGSDRIRFTRGGIVGLLEESGFQVRELGAVVGTLATGLHLRQLAWCGFLESRHLGWLAAPLNVVTNLRMALEDALSPEGLRLSSPVILTCAAIKRSGQP